MTPKMIMIVGLPASGKSYKAIELAEEFNANIHSSDSIREELLNDVNNQDNNNLVFQTLHKRIKEDLRNHKNCIYDATNISYKRRMAFLQELNNIDCDKICVFMATPYEECIARNNARSRKVPEAVIEKMYKQIDVPDLYEGWDVIKLVYAPNSDNYYGLLDEWIKSVDNYNQDNTHHALSLGEHCRQTYSYIKKISDCDTYCKKELLIAGLLHDCGKPFCKTFENSKGETTKQAHYYHHENVGAYNSLFYDYGLLAKHSIAILIRLHMLPYFWEKDNNTKMQNKYRKLWGEELYNAVMLLHDADKSAH